MAHSVSFDIPKRELGRADVTFDVNAAGDKLGTLTVSKGSVVWFPKDNSYGYKLDGKSLIAHSLSTVPAPKNANGRVPSSPEVRLTNAAVAGAELCERVPALVCPL